MIAVIIADMSSTWLDNYQVHFNNSEEFHSLKREIFSGHCYYVDLDLVEEKYLDRPIKILDAGAHIGLSSLYFAKLFPHSLITALEPLPANFALLEKNIFENQLSENIFPQQIALSDQKGTQTFFFDESHLEWYSTAGFFAGAWNRQQKSNSIEVPTLPLSYFLAQDHFDIIKIDIEGAEQKVLIEARDFLTNADHYLVEYHPVRGNNLPQLVTLFQEKRFKVRLFTNGQIVKETAKGLVMLEATKI